MKRHPLFHRFLTIPAILSATVCLASGTPDGDTDHTPRDFDRLGSAVSFSPSAITSIDSTRRIANVNPASFITEDGNEARIYIEGDTVSYVQFATKHRFLLHSDTLSYMGFENRASDFRFDSPSAMAVFPMNAGDGIHGEWSGHLFRYGTMMLKHVRGRSSASVQDGWSITDGTDTVRNVRRLAWVLDMAYADPDSVNSQMPDSVACGIISDMQVDVKTMLSERLLTERTMWFSEDARYPILTESRVSRMIPDKEGTAADTVSLAALSIYYPALSQQYDTGEKIAVRKPKDTERTDGDGGAPSGDRLSVGAPEADGESVSVTLCAPSGKTTAVLTLFSDTGIRLSGPVEVSVGTVPGQYSIAAPPGWNGVMFLHVETDEETFTEKIIR